MFLKNNILFTINLSLGKVRQKGMNKLLNGLSLNIEKHWKSIIQWVIKNYIINIK